MSRNHSFFKPTRRTSELALSCYKKIPLERNDQLLLQAGSCNLERVGILLWVVMSRHGVGNYQVSGVFVLYGTEFLPETDHHPMQYLRQAKLQNERLMRWALTLQPYRSQSKPMCD